MNPQAVHQDTAPPARHQTASKDRTTRGNACSSERRCLNSEASGSLLRCTTLLASSNDIKRAGRGPPAVLCTICATTTTSVGQTKSYLASFHREPTNYCRVLPYLRWSFLYCGSSPSVPLALPLGLSVLLGRANGAVDDAHRIPDEGPREINTLPPRPRRRTAV